MKKTLTLFVVWFCCATLKAQIPACDTNAVKTAMATAGYTRFIVTGYPCSMYFVNNGNKTWAASQADAAAVGGNLISINSSTQNANVVAGLLAAGYPNTDNFWIGLNAQGSTSGSPTTWGWNWKDGSPYVYQNWSGGAPDNASGWPGNPPEDAVQLKLSDGNWNTLMSQNAGLFPAPTGKGIIEINLCPNLSATAGASVCQGLASSITASGTLGSSPFSYSVFAPPSVVPVVSGNTSGTINLSAPNVGANNYLVLLQDRYGCPDTQTVVITTTNCTTPTTTCNLTAIRAAFTAAGHYTELVVPGQSCSITTVIVNKIHAAT